MYKIHICTAQYRIEYVKRVVGYIGNSIVSNYQQIRPGMETANISHIDVSMRTKVCNEPNGGISLSCIQRTLSWDIMV
jgi:hypothetical protein